MHRLACAMCCVGCAVSHDVRVGMLCAFVGLGLLHCHHCGISGSSSLRASVRKRSRRERND
eukprot:2566399-Alexandrium_andersonii.AAC.1